MTRASEGGLHPRPTAEMRSRGRGDPRGATMTGMEAGETEDPEESEFKTNNNNENQQTNQQKLKSTKETNEKLQQRSQQVFSELQEDCTERQVK